MIEKTISSMNVNIENAAFFQLSTFLKFSPIISTDVNVWCLRPPASHEVNAITCPSNVFVINTTRTFIKKINTTRTKISLKRSTTSLLLHSLISHYDHGCQVGVFTTTTTINGDDRGKETWKRKGTFGW